MTVSVLPPRIAEKILESSFNLKDSFCWKWLGAKNNKGYGTVWFQGKVVLTHRLSYQLLVGPIPEGLQLDHLCRCRTCCNPAHLEPVTARENSARGSRLITHCPQGHLYEEENTYIDPRGWRSCRACKRARELLR